MRRLFKRLRRRLEYMDDLRVELIREAYLFAAEGHDGQKRRTGEPYITHPVDVACILAEYKLDHLTIIAALLHDTIEDTAISKEDIISRFGETAANIVDGVSKLEKISFASRLEAQAENFRKMILAMTQDIRVILVKLADRLHNMRTLGALHPQKKRRIARETLEIFSPIAKRLGMREMSMELEELSFSALYPMRHRVLQNAVRRARGNRKKVLGLIDKTFREGLQAAQFPTCAIEGREKHLYSIYRKMVRKKLTFSEIMDVYAFRLIVDSVDTCYRVLGLVHCLFKPVPERFKDYIAIPKANGYQSLHTTLFGPYGLPIEVQIRTTDMDRLANQGIAAHWLYKKSDESGVMSEHRAQAWVQNLLEMQRDSGSSLDFIESVKIDLFPDEVYVFTPRGDIVSLPAGSTPIDLAYSVHTDIGNHCVSVRIDRQVASLSAPLSNGQTVEIVTSETARPSPAWLDFVVTGKAKAAIRHYLKTRKRQDSITLGRQLLKKALSALGVPLRKVDDAQMAEVLRQLNYTSLDDVLEDIGLGNRLAAMVAQQLIQASTLSSTVEQDDAPLMIQGTEGMAIELSDCCHPIPGDPLIGVIRVGHGIRVHRESCPVLLRLRRHPERMIPLRWAHNDDQDFTSILRLELGNKQGVLAEVMASVAQARTNIENIEVIERTANYAIIDLQLMVQSRQHLAVVLRELRGLRSVLKVVRP